jgi:hypothetical protein
MERCHQIVDCLSSTTARDHMLGATLKSASHVGIAKGRGVTGALKFEVILIDAARRVDRKHKLQIERDECAATIGALEAEFAAYGKIEAALDAAIEILTAEQQGRAMTAGVPG